MLRGVGGQLPFGLPPLLEHLEYSAGCAMSARSAKFESTHLDAAAEAICSLPNLSFLKVQHSLTYLPSSFVSRLPTSLRVGHRLCSRAASVAVDEF